MRSTGNRRMPKLIWSTISPLQAPSPELRPQSNLLRLLWYRTYLFQSLFRNLSQLLGRCRQQRRWKRKPF